MKTDHSNPLEQARWIDRYLDGELSGFELQRFMDQLEKDAEFRTRVSLRNLMIEGIRQASDEELHSRIESGIRYRRPMVPVGLKLLITFFIVTGVGIILWNYTGVNSDSDRSFLRLGWLKKRTSEKRTLPTGKVAKTAESKRKVVSSSVAVEPDGGKTALTDTMSESFAQDSTLDAAGEIVVRKDQLLVALELAVQEEGKQDKPQSMESKVVERLNPAAGLVETASSPRKIETEFWISPVNYRGYRLLENKLVLYGLDAPDQVSLFRADNHVLLKYNNEVYVLTESEDFQPYPRSQEAARNENR